MHWTLLTVSALICLVAVAIRWRWSAFRERGVGPWMLTYFRETLKRRQAGKTSGEIHILLCIADHFEPQWGGASSERAAARVARWTRDYPRLCQRFRDSDGCPPRQSFFFPIDEYDDTHVESIEGLCRAGYGELEIHLHHDHDTSDGLRERLLRFKGLFADRHSALSRHRDTGELAYGFIHGNWALDNSRPDGRWCGVNNELDVLRETGCYADFTLPSFPSPTQTRKINSLFYAKDDPRRPKSHDWGTDVGVVARDSDTLMVIQGPLVLNWASRKWGIVPRVENGAIQHNQPPTMKRLDLWLQAAVRVATRPDWFFVKLHTHGAPERNAEILLGPAMIKFHEGLARRARENPRFHYHYVTARELYNLARAAESEWAGDVNSARDFELVSNFTTGLSALEAVLSRHVVQGI